MNSNTVCQTDAVIEVRGVSKSFKTVRAVDQVSLAIGRGEYVALLGPNGAGKTTLVEMIEGIQKPDVGSIAVLGQPWQGHETRLRSRLGICLQETRFIDKLTAEETLDLFGSFYGQGRQRTREVLDLVNLADKRKSYVVNLSGGQRQKLALGVAVINQPEILLLDEPTVGLDPNSRQEIWSILRQFKERCATLILTTHYMEEAHTLCERIIIMDQGRFLAEGTFEALLAEHADGEVLDFLVREEVAHWDMSAIPGVIQFDWNPESRRGRLLVRSKTGALMPFLQVLRSQGLTLEDLEFRKMSLDDLFISLTGRHLDA